MDVTYQNANRDVSQEADRPLPWSTTIQAASGDFVYISAQNQGESGEVTCAIDVDGTTAEANTSTGAYTICTASGKL